MGKQKKWKSIFACFVAAILFVGMFGFLGATNNQAQNVANAISAKAVASSVPIEVASYEELETALDLANENTEIVVTQCITLPDDTVLDGHGAIVRVVCPYVSEDGIVRDGEYSDYSVFELSGNKTATLKNMKIFGGKKVDNHGAVYGAVFVYEETTNIPTLTMENVTISRSYRGLDNNGGKVVLKNCNIVRNVCDYGGGILCAGGTIVMDSCSLSENYSIGIDGGGGAIEINNSGKLYANNTVIINNSSSEIGGAINCYNSNIFLANCTISGNVTTAADAYYGGGIGLNDNDSLSNGFYAVNTIITDNYHIVGNEKKRSDVGVYSDTRNGFISCLIGEIVVSPGIDPAPTINKYYCPDQDVSSTFAAKYRNDGVLIKDDAITIDFPHPAAISKTRGVAALYVPVKSDKAAASGGVATYFDYEDLTDIKMGCWNSATSSIEKICGSVAPDAAKVVNTYYEGGTRDGSVIGASKASNTNYYTITLAKGFANGEVFGATIYGDTYEENTPINVEGKADNGYMFEYWIYVTKDMQSNTNSTKITANNPYVIEVTEDATLIPIFSEQTATETPQQTQPQNQNLPLWAIIVIVALGVSVVLMATLLVVKSIRKGGKDLNSVPQKPAKPSAQTITRVAPRQNTAARQGASKQPSAQPKSANIKKPKV